MMGIVKSLLTCLCLFGASLGMGGCDYASSHNDMAQLWGALGAGVVDILKAPDAVEYYKIVPALPGPANQTYQPAGKVQSLSSEDVSKLQKLLLSDRSYQFRVLKKCVFVPETAFRFKKGEKDVLVLVSMSCKQIKYDLEKQADLLDIDPAAESFAEFIAHLPN